MQFVKINLYSIAATDKIPKIISADKTKEVLNWFQTEAGELTGVFYVKLNVTIILTVNIEFQGRVANGKSGAAK